MLLLAAAMLLPAPISGFGEEPAPSPATATPAPAAMIEEWLNQTVRLRDTVEARDRPSADGKPAGRIRAGAEVTAVGIVGDGRWVKIELADQVFGYVPVDAIQYEDTPAARPAASDRPGPEPATTAVAPPPPTSSPSAPSPSAPSPSAPAVVAGPATRVPNAATLVVADHRIRLSGIDPGPLDALGPFETWVRSQGALECEPDAKTGRYHCFTHGGVDVAEAAILNGAGRVGEGATPAYRERETEARQAHRGLWAQP